MRRLFAFFLLIVLLFASSVSCAENELFETSKTSIYGYSANEWYKTADNRALLTVNLFSDLSASGLNLISNDINNVTKLTSYVVYDKEKASIWVWFMHNDIITFAVYYNPDPKYNEAYYDKWPTVNLQNIEQQFEIWGDKNYSKNTPKNINNALNTLLNKQAENKPQVTLSPEPMIAYSVSIEKEFSLGDRSTLIYDAKKQMAKLGYWSSADIKDDHFSSDFMEAIKRYQKDNDIYADGKLSIETQIKLFGDMGVLLTPTPASSPTPTPKATPVVPYYTPRAENSYSLGDTGEEIRKIKKQLEKLGYFTDDNTDIFTSSLSQAIRNFQRDYKLPANGKVDKITRNALISAVSKPLPEGIKLHYKSGDEGEDVKNIKLELQKYGYYRYNSTFDGEYNSTMVERVKLFQNANGLEVTGEIDENMLFLLFNGKPRKTNEYATATPRPTATPKPTATPYKEPTYALKQAGYAKWDVSNNIPWFSIEVENTSEKKTVDGVTVEFYATDVYGDKMGGYGGENYYYEVIINTTIKPGRTAYLDKIYAYPFENAKRIYHRIAKIHFTDGTSVSYPQSGSGAFWYIEYEY